MTAKLQEDQCGYIALLSIVIVSAVLLIMTISVSATSVLGRVNILDYQYKQVSTALAEGCINTAILKSIHNPGYNPINELVSIGLDYCAIVSITTLGSEKVIHAQGVYPSSGNNRSYTNLEARIIINQNSLAINSWSELANF